MNLLLLWPEEVAEGMTTLVGRRADHVRRQLKKQVGEEVAVGVLGESVGRALIVSLSQSELVLQLTEQRIQPPPTTHLILAVPRPKALSRLIQHATAFGLAQIDLIRTARVEASYLESSRLSSARIEKDLLFGLEQGRRVHLPMWSVSPRLGPYLERLSELSQSGPRLVCHPAASQFMNQALARYPKEAPCTLAFGPDGGFIQEELDALAALGFRPVTLGTGVLRTEAAISAGLAQLELCRQLSTVPG